MNSWNIRKIVVLVTTGLLVQSNVALAQVVARSKVSAKPSSTMFNSNAKKYRTWTLAQMDVRSDFQGTTTLKIDDLRKADEKENDSDNEITDARLRAQLGSKSRWSLKSSLAYSGGSVERPFDAIRPNYRASADIESMTSLSGDLGLNFRFTDKDNIGIGTGLTVVDPFHGDISKPVVDPRYDKADSIARYQFSTPFINWTRGYRLWDTQMVSSATYSHATDSDSLKAKTFGSFSFSQTILKNFGTSGWNGGASISVGKYFYTGDVEDPNTLKKMAAGAFMRTDVSSGLFPFIQYQFNDRYSFRTIFGYFQFVKYETLEEPIQVEPYQSVGLGISITRDIYIYPNVQFTPKDIRADRTNVALSTNINLF